MSNKPRNLPDLGGPTGRSGSLGRYYCRQTPDNSIASIHPLAASSKRCFFSCLLVAEEAEHEGREEKQEKKKMRPKESRTNAYRKLPNATYSQIVLLTARAQPSQKADHLMGLTATVPSECRASGARDVPRRHSLAYSSKKKPGENGNSAHNPDYALLSSSWRRLTSPLSQCSTIPRSKPIPTTSKPAAPDETTSRLLPHRTNGSCSNGSLCASDVGHPWQTGADIQSELV